MLTSLCKAQLLLNAADTTDILRRIQEKLAAFIGQDAHDLSCGLKWASLGHILGIKLQGWQLDEWATFELRSGKMVSIDGDLARVLKEKLGE